MHASDDSDTPPVLPDEVPGDDTAVGDLCGNCSTPLRGEYCYVCGQPIHGLVRHFTSIAGDFFDTVLNYDARLPRTLWPLLSKPAFLTREYFAGRRVRYVSPVRLFVTLSIVTFFIAQLLLSFGDEPLITDGGSDGFGKAGTVAEVIEKRDAALKDITDARKGESGVPGLNVGLGAAERAIRDRADKRIRELENPGATGSAADVASAEDRASKVDPTAQQDAAQAADAAGDSAVQNTSNAPAKPASTAGAAPDAVAAGDRTKDTNATARDANAPSRAAPDAAKTDTAKAGADDKSDDDNFDEMFDLPVNGKPWDPKTNPFVVSWLPKFANDGLNSLMLRAKNNVQRWQKNPDQFKDAVLSAVPSTLFVLLPLFALLLKIFYVFKRRLYMEHLIVALHSHAFLCQALLLMFGAMALRDAIPSGTGFWYGLLGWVEAALWIWMPLYLLLMQKRVYAQGWPMTLLKFAVLGWCYAWMLGFGAALTVMFSVVWG